MRSCGRQSVATPCRRTDLLCTLKHGCRGRGRKMCAPSILHVVLASELPLQDRRYVPALKGLIEISSLLRAVLVICRGRAHDICAEIAEKPGRRFTNTLPKRRGRRRRGSRRGIRSRPLRLGRHRRRPRRRGTAWSRGTRPLRFDWGRLRHGRPRARGASTKPAHRSISLVSGREPIGDVLALAAGQANPGPSFARDDNVLCMLTRRSRARSVTTKPRPAPFGRPPNCAPPSTRGQAPKTTPRRQRT